MLAASVALSVLMAVSLRTITSLPDARFALAMIGAVLARRCPRVAAWVSDEQIHSLVFVRIGRFSHSKLDRRATSISRRCRTSGPCLKRGGIGGADC